ncbi:MAG: tail fiber domain-containing protein, partial [Candidatus Shapirobacteria bacterium]
QGAYALYSNIDGSLNSAQGAYALYSNIDGSLNSAQGAYALYSNIYGSSNSAQGYYALYNNTLGNYNSAYGATALYNLTGSYSNNTALGTGSGSYYNGSTGSLTQASNSLFLGASASALANGGTNEIVIGYNAIGAGSNSVVLGNDSITKTILKGSIGIGTTAPAEKLDVVGNIQSDSNIMGAKFLSVGNTLYGLVANNIDPAKNSLSLANTGSIKFNNNDTSGSTNLRAGAASRIQNFTNGLLLAVGTGSTAVGQPITGWDNQLFLNGNGFVGIGTTNPQTALDIAGTLTVPTINASAGSTAVVTSGTVYSAIAVGYFDFSNDLVPSPIPIGSKGVYQVTFTSGTLNGNSYVITNAYNNSSWGSKDYFTISGSVSVPSSGDTFTVSLLPLNPLTINGNILSIGGTAAFAPSYSFGLDTSSGMFNPLSDTLAFSTSGYERLRINSSGYLGIGTTNPTSALHVIGSANFTSNLQIGGTTVISASKIHLATNGIVSAPSHTFISDTNTGMYRGGTDILRFATAGLDRLTILANGKVGIGTTNPAKYLVVKGSGSTALNGETMLRLVYGADDYGDLGIDFAHRISDSDGLVKTAIVARSIGPLTYGRSDLHFVLRNTADAVPYSTGTDTRMIIKANGRVGIGTTAPSYQLQLSTNSAAKPTSSSWTVVSDSRLKKDITSFTDGLNIINQINPVNYTLNGKAGLPDNEKSIGIIAQDIMNIAPYTVGTFYAKLNPEDTEETKLYNFDSSALIYVAINAIKELDEEIVKINKDLSLTTTGEININYNIDESILSSLGYNDSKNEIESATYSLNDSLGNITNRIAQFSEIASAKIKTGFLSATNIITKNLLAEKINTKELVSPKANIDELTVNTATVSGTLVASDIQTTSIITDTLVTKEATISTLYADNIISKEGSFGDLMAEKVSSLRDELKKLITTNTASSSAITGTSIMSQSSTWSMDIASNSAKITGDLELTNNLIIGAKLIVNGDTQLGNAFVTGTFTTGEIAIKDNFIETTNSALYIQPSNTGSVHIMGDTLVIADTGDVEINGNLKISGSLMANLITADEIQTNKLTSKEINSDQIKIATDSAQTIIAETGFAAIATSSAKLTSNATAGTAVLPAGKSEIIITNNKLTQNSMVYLTPVGSTKNQVPYIKNKIVSTIDDLTYNNSFTIALDNYLDQDIEINWWIIN